MAARPQGSGPGPSKLGQTNSAARPNAAAKRIGNGKTASPNQPGFGTPQPRSSAKGGRLNGGPTAKK